MGSAQDRIVLFMAIEMRIRVYSIDYAKPDIRLREMNVWLCTGSWLRNAMPKVL